MRYRKARAAAAQAAGLQLEGKFWQGNRVSFSYSSSSSSSCARHI
jgi:hypothetical protein